jgi:hypothetical protein
MSSEDSKEGYLKNEKDLSEEHLFNNLANSLVILSINNKSITTLIINTLPLKSLIVSKNSIKTSDNSEPTNGLGSKLMYLILLT